jgi:hypothetical protein
MLTHHVDVKNSIIPEDQAAIVEGDVAEIIKLCQQEKLPCVVAIKGNIPNIQPQGHCGKSSRQSWASVSPRHMATALTAYVAADPGRRLNFNSTSTKSIHAKALVAVFLTV